jgi:hypothetical protein
MKRNFIAKLCGALLFFGLLSVALSAQTITIPTGSFIINMGVTPQTVTDKFTLCSEPQDLVSSHCISDDESHRSVHAAISGRNNPENNHRNALTLFFLPGLFIVFRARDFSSSAMGENEGNDRKYAKLLAAVDADIQQYVGKCGAERMSLPSSRFGTLRRKSILFTLFLGLGLFPFQAWTQVNNNGCVGGGFGIDAGLYSNIIEFGTGSPAAGSKDWFYSSGSGLSVIDVSNSAAIQTLLQGTGNPTYEARMNSGLNSIVNGQIMIDAIFARDQFGGTGGIDQTSYSTASKNGEDPAIWDPGASNVLGKNDLIDVAGHMFRDGTGNSSDLWFVGLINRAEPGGAAYMDFEFYVEEVQYNPATGFTSGGPQLGHTAFTFDGGGNITKIGDIIFNVALTGGGSEVGVEMRIWVSRADWLNITPANFSWSGQFDGAFNGSPFGYASIVPLGMSQICGYVNKDNELPAAPPWGTKNTKSHVYGTSYIAFSVVVAPPLVLSACCSRILPIPI